MARSASTNQITTGIYSRTIEDRSRRKRPQSDAQKQAALEEWIARQPTTWPDTLDAIERELRKFLRGKIKLAKPGQAASRVDLGDGPEWYILPAAVPLDESGASQRRLNQAQDRNREAEKIRDCVQALNCITTLRFGGTMYDAYLLGRLVERIGVRNHEAFTDTGRRIAVGATAGGESTRWQVSDDELARLHRKVSALIPRMGITAALKKVAAEVGRNSRTLRRHFKEHGLPL